ncbi:transmembrane reductase CYB561D2-like isoform X1 [Daphnia pulicaria]|uniref:transmembrane reductase CYB561D2-like isoform X1 n=1 Tax=Daphnia pulicaria TaxID=35523 RepID=UPI001EEC72EE|nr:transmembrane reductase CYB561D2-like isoform X1 [Daphnia pulicaria]
MFNRDGLSYLLVHGTIILSTIYLSYLSNPGSSLFSWHPFLMTLSMLFLANELVMIFSPYWSLLPKRFQKQLFMDFHTYGQVVAFIGYSIGFAAIYINKEDNEKPHFKSWHGLLGLIQAIIITSQLSLGSLAKYARYIPLKLNVGKIKGFHNLLGAVAILFTSLNMITACFTNFFSSQTHILLAYVFSAAFVLIYGFVSLRVFMTNSRIAQLFK